MFNVTELDLTGAIGNTDIPTGVKFSTRYFPWQGFKTFNLLFNYEVLAGTAGLNIYLGIKDTDGIPRGSVLAGVANPIVSPTSPLVSLPVLAAGGVKGMTVFNPTQNEASGSFGCDDGAGPLALHPLGPAASMFLVFENVAGTDTIRITNPQLILER